MGEADLGPQPAHDQFLAAGCPDRFDELLILPRVDAGAIVGGHTGEYLSKLWDRVAVDAIGVADMANALAAMGLRGMLAGAKR